MEKSRNIQLIYQKKDDLLKERMIELNRLVVNNDHGFSESALNRFMEILCAKMPIEFLASLDAKQIFGFVTGRFEFVQQNVNRPISVEVHPFTLPELENNHSAIILEFLVKDRPFVMDSLTEYIHGRKYRSSLMLYPVISLSTAEDGKINTVSMISEDVSTNYNYVCCIIENFDILEKEALQNDILSVLHMVCAVTDDFKAIGSVVDEYAKEKKDEAESLIESERRRLFTWFNEGNVVLLGSGEIEKEFVSENLAWSDIKNCLGYIRRKNEIKDDHLTKEIGRLGRFFLETGLTINIIELSEFSMVHRRDRIQVVFLRKRDASGQVKVVFLYVLFTNKVNKEAAMAIPLARLKVNAILEKAVEGDNIEQSKGHLYKTTHDFFNVIPKSELFRMDRMEMTAIFDQFIYFGDYQTTKLTIYTQPSRRYARLTFCLPNTRFSQDVFINIDHLLTERLGHSAEIKYWFQLGRNIYSHHVFWFPDDHPQLDNIDIEVLESEVARLTLGWIDDFQALLRQYPLGQRKALEDKYSHVFGSFYQAVFTAENAIDDIQFLEALQTDKREKVDVRHDDVRGETVIYLFSDKSYHLTHIMPILQNLSLTVIDENTYKLDVNGGRLYIYTYYVSSLKDEDQKFPGFRDKFCELLLAVLEEETENDVLNGLLLSAGMDMREINLFMLFRNYYWQIGAPYLPINQSFLANPKVIQSLLAYFTAKFSPQQNPNGPNPDKLTVFEKGAAKEVETVKTVAEDIIFKTVFNLMQSTIRTNYFNIDADSTMAIKIESTKVERMPNPKPMYEIYTHGPRMEGIHLRGAMIARGGLRHSDRHSDFRSEVLGLMNTQMLKNVVIVPEGSKGGFITKRQFADRELARQEAETQYRTYINSLLSLTDNIVDGEIVPAKGLIRYDSDDPYLVVAADKGTAALSDTANSISEARGFWLKDAFASGGKHGYDHKKMAITARGAWECVKLHFLEEGKDIQTTPFSVVGIGDMSGDVFGNGMLLSRFICLKGAFNHMHIFVDPDPDPESSWIERKRLFDSPGSTWMDYNLDLISKGGGIFERSAKTIKLTPEIQQMVGVSVESVSGEALIQLLLKAEVDLLWNGGIGTYIKASQETNRQVSDAANDAVRIDASELRAKVVGEGGNLGLTQQARLEAAIKGVKLNTDAIDNSGGVDTSDHEVNLKILMDALINDGQLKSAEERNQLLETLTDDIARLVLLDNQAQGQIMSMDSNRSKKDMKPVFDLVTHLIKLDLLHPKTDHLSSREELEEYFQEGLGVPRPDLAVLLSLTKMHFYKEVLKSGALSEPLLNDRYYEYFPETLRNRYNITAFQHPLKNEIIGTVLVNKIVNQAGITLWPEISSIIEVTSTDIIVAYTVIDEVFELDRLRDKVMDELRLENINSAYTLLIDIEKFIRSVLLWMLIYFKADELRFSMIGDYKDQVIEYLSICESIMEPAEKNEILSISENLKTLGISSELALDLSRGAFMARSLETIVLSNHSNISLNDAIILNQGIDKLFYFRTLSSKITRAEAESSWSKQHKGLLIRQIILLKQKISDKILSNYKEALTVSDKFTAYQNEINSRYQKYQMDFDALTSSDKVDLSGITILLNGIENTL